MVKKLLVTALCIAMILTMLAGCGSTATENATANASEGASTEGEASAEVSAAESAEETPVLAYVGYEGDIFNITARQGIQDKCEELGIEFQSLSYLPDDGEQATARMLEDALAMEVDMVVLETQHPEAAMGILPNLIEAGVKVTVLNDRVDVEGITAYVGQDYVERCYISGFPMFEMLGEGKNTLIITGPEEFQACVDIGVGYTNAAEENGVVVLDILNTSGTGDTTTAVTEDAITRFGLDGIDSICTWAPSIATAVAAVLENAGANPGDIPIACQGGFKIEYDLFEQGWLYSTIGSPAYALGAACVQYAYDGYMTGEVFGDIMIADDPITIDNYNTTDYFWLE